MTDHSMTLPAPINDLLAYYAGKMVDGDAPIRGDHFSPSALRPWLGCVALISCDADNFKCRLMGTKLFVRFGLELTGRRFDELDNALLGDLPDRIRRCVTQVSPVLGRAKSPDGRLDFAEILLPLRGEDGKIDTILLACYPAKN